MAPARWTHIADDLRERISRGEWEPGEKLPTNRELMQQYDTKTQGTVARAVAALIAEGIVISDPTAPRLGVRVRARHLVCRDLARTLQLEYRRAHAQVSHNGEGLFEATTGTDAFTRVAVEYTNVTATDSIAERLDLPEGAPLLRRIFTYSLDDTPHQVATSFISVSVAEAAGLITEADETMGDGTIAQLLRGGIEVDEARVNLECRQPTPAERQSLLLPAGIPVFIHSRTLYADDRPVETGYAVVASDQIAYTLDINLAGAATCQ